jgi:tRNA pseudouridine32 synthase/23S rRNA pseudouridine746 synthase
LGLLFKHGKIGKTYWAVVEGGPDAGEGTIDLPLGRLNEERGWWMKPDPHGLPSMTTWKVMGRSAADAPATDAEREKRFTWLALTPVTGRTHQLRVHCAASGWPIVGDNIYGNAPRFTGPPQMLHAREVVVPISKNKPPVRVTAPVPEHMRDALRASGWKEEEP